MNPEERFSTPMMKQYLGLKKSNPDSLLFFRLGDFYEMFLDDAKVASDVLGITLTRRSRGKDGNIPMAGVPFHAVDGYISKLVRAGYSVAMCEQLSDPMEPGLVKRDVVRVITPGTLLDETALDKKRNNFVLAVQGHQKYLDLAIADISTGTLYTLRKSHETSKELIDILSKFNIQECILPESLYEDKKLNKLLSTANVKNIHKVENEVMSASDFLLKYLRHTQKSELKHIKNIKDYLDEDTLEMDRSTMFNLELFSTIREQDSKGTLIEMIDRTRTAIGGRQMKNWLSKPLVKRKSINDRQDLVEKYTKDRQAREKLQRLLENISDIERLVARISVGLGNPRDLINLKNSLKHTLAVKELLTEGLVLEKSINTRITKTIRAVANEIEKTIIDEPPVDPKQGGVIKAQVSLELDGLKDSIASSKNWVAQLETQEKSTTGINTLKVRFNKVFGFYIEVSRASSQNVPEHYERRQTLVNAERYITPELKTHEEIILTAEEKINKLEYEIFLDLVKYISKNIGPLQNSAEAIGELDCILSFAQNAEEKNYCRPIVNTTGGITIKGGRHPVVENLLENREFVPNDVRLDNNENQLLVITGPNMAGKSVYMRQIALLVLMAQMGSFIPAESAQIEIVDKIFVRSGAADVIAAGLSTFMVEMIETANILNNATNDSLIIMDEIGRGTSTYDGISIAWSVAEFLVANKASSPKTLFATHYHELEDLERHFPNKIKNIQMAIYENGGDPIFLHKVVPGGAGYSYGISVAKLAGVPENVTSRAQEILKQLEKGEFRKDDKN